MEKVRQIIKETIRKDKAELARFLWRSCRVERGITFREGRLDALWNLLDELPQARHSKPCHGEARRPDVSALRLETTQPTGEDL